MDEEFESQSTKIKNKFDATMKDELTKVAAKVKEDYKFTLDIRLAEQRQDLLVEKLNFLSDLNGEKEIELVNLRLRQSQINEANKKLEKALAQSETELEKLSELAQKKRGWWF
jgi:NMD protein affecting ribosome stability and mRNA decay